MIGMDVVAVGGGGRHEADGIGCHGLPVGFPDEVDGVGDQPAARRANSDSVVQEALAERERRNGERRLHHRTTTIAFWRRHGPSRICGNARMTRP
jgi:hypothetical protein